MDELVVEIVADIDAAWPELEPLYVAIHEYHQPFTGEVLQPGWQGAQRAALTTAAEGFVAIARQDGRPVGFIDAVIRRDPGLFGIDVVYVNTAFVDAALRGQGVGRRLTREVEDWGRALGVQRLDLSVRTANVEGVAAWRAMGFEDLSLRLTRRVLPSASDRT